MGNCCSEDKYKPSSDNHTGGRRNNNNNNNNRGRNNNNNNNRRRRNRDNGGRDPKPDVDEHKEDPRPTNTITYEPTDVGTFELTRDYRKYGIPDPPQPKPKIPLGEKYSDLEYPLERATRKLECNYQLHWKRPEEFREDPQLFTKGTTRFDISQRSLGSCWFLAVLANIADRPLLLKRILDQESYSILTGLFHCHFWRFGKWRDVYIDDFLPVYVKYNQYWMWTSRSTDENEMWVSLVEKALGRMYGSYSAIHGGQPEDAYLALTGGVSEVLTFDEESKISKETLYRRVRNGLASGALVTCSVPEKNDKLYGLHGPHAYSLTGTQEVETLRGERIRLLRVRNPWGHTEWTGDWNDKDSKWDAVSSEIRRRNTLSDGEFWISVQDFMMYFDRVTLSSITPDIDLDGRPDYLNFVTNIYGEWKGSTAAGYRNVHANTGFEFSLASDGMRHNGIPLVIQIIQKLDDGREAEVAPICYLFDDTGHRIKADNESMSVYRSEQLMRRFMINPTKDHIVYPCTFTPGIEKEFLVRIYSQSPLQNIGIVNHRRRRIW